MSQDMIAVEHHARGDDGTWHVRYLGPGDRMTLASCGGAEVRVDDLYLKVFPDSR